MSLRVMKKLTIPSPMLLNMDLFAFVDAEVLIDEIDDVAVEAAEPAV